MEHIMVRTDAGSHQILKKWKKKLREQGISIPLGGAIREMEKMIKEPDKLGFSKTDLKTVRHALGKLNEISKKYDNPHFSEVIVRMDAMIKGENES